MKSASRYLLLFIILSISYLELHGQPIDENKLFKDPCNYCQTNSFRSYFNKRITIPYYKFDTSCYDIFFFAISFKEKSIDSVYQILPNFPLDYNCNIFKKSEKLWDYNYVKNRVLIIEISAIKLGPEYYYDKNKPYPKLAIDREKYVKEIFKKFPNCVFLPPFVNVLKLNCILTNIIRIDTISVPLKK